MSGLGITLTYPGGLARTGKDRLATLANASPRGGRSAVLGLTVLCVAIGAPPPRAHACPAPVTSSRQSADDTIDHVTIAAEPRQLYIHMKSGRVYCYLLIRSAKIPPPGRGYEGTKAGVTLTIRKPGFSPYWNLALRGGKTSNTQAWRRTRARGRFRVDVIGKGAVPGKETVPGESASARSIGVLSTEQIRQLEARGLQAGAAKGIAEKLAKGKALTVSEARALLDALSRSSVGQKHGPLVPSDRTWWLEWMRRHGGKADSLGDSPRRGKDSLSPRDVTEILAKHKEYVGVKDPPAVTARELRRRIPYDPELIRSWNGLAPWERDLWRAYWKRHPDRTQSASKSLALTQAVRFRMALQMSPDYLGEGAREAARALFNDPVFIIGTVVGITLYVIAILNPEPLFSKAAAAAVTTALLTVFTLSEITHLVTAWFRLRARAGNAQTMAELDAAARDFGTALGGTGLRILLALSTYLGGKVLPAPKPGATTTPSAPAAVTPGGALVVAPRTLIIQGTRVTVLADGTVITAPILASATASGAGGNGGSGTQPSATTRPPNTKGGGKNERKSHLKRQRTLQLQLEKAQQRLQHATTKKERAAIKREIKHIRLKMRQSEPHSINPARH